MMDMIDIMFVMKDFMADITKLMDTVVNIYREWFPLT